MQHDHNQKKSFDLLTKPNGSRVRVRQNMCLHGALHSISINLICNMSTFRRKAVLTPSQGSVVCVRTEYVFVCCSMFLSL